MAKPFLKWVGGKTKLVNQITSNFPKIQEENKYIEPFVGGGAVYFKLNPKKSLLLDSNADLIATYCAVRDNVEGVHKELAPIIKYSTITKYYSIRSVYNEEKSSLSNEKLAAYFIYLNKTCFNGIYRVNKNGHFNVPKGDSVESVEFDFNNLRLASEALKNAKICCLDFRHIGPYCNPGDLVYFDPPYDNTFTSYTTKAFARDSQRDLRNLALELIEKGCFVLVSNSNTSFIKDLYLKDFDILNLHAYKSVSGKAHGRKSSDELLIIGKQ